MTRCKAFAIFTLVLLVTLIPLVTAPHDAAASTLRSRLVAARARLSHAQHRLRDARAALVAATAPPALSAAVTDPTPAATPVATPVATPSPAPSASPAPLSPAPSLDQLRARVVHWRRIVLREAKAVGKLARAYHLQRQLATWELDHRWRPIIEYAAARYHVSADGIYRMMMHESGGRQYAGAGATYKGLFQYCTGTWTASWNPWRHDSIYDASSQIFATCYAVHKGYGPSMWTTYAISF